MEAILELYRLPYDPNIPMLCMDGQSYQFLSEKREPIPWDQGRASSKRIMGMFEKEAAIALCSPNRWAGGGMYMRRDWALRIQELLDAQYQKASKMRLVMDNLNTHTVSSLYSRGSAEIGQRTGTTPHAETREFA
jgi:hypothetical protein